MLLLSLVQVPFAPIGPTALPSASSTFQSNVVPKLRRAVTVRGEDHPAKSPLSMLRSPLLRPLSPPPVDDEVRALERQVDEASQRVAALRASMQSQLQERIAEQLARARPAAQTDEGFQAAVSGETGGDAAVVGPAESMATDCGDAGQQPAPASPRTQVLQERLAVAAAKLPALRARLEEASGRLQRVMGVAASQLDAPPPNTVEKAVLGKTPGPPAAAPSSISGRDVAPVPLAAPLESDQ